jgi:hypothetical protein
MASEDDKVAKALAILGWENEVGRTLRDHLDTCSPDALREIVSVLEQNDEGEPERIKTLSRELMKEVQSRLGGDS